MQNDELLKNSQKTTKNAKMSINSQKNEEKKRTISKNKLKKYITVQRIKTKNKNLLLFSEQDKENIEKINNLNTYLTNQINNEIYKTKKSISNSNKAFNHFLKSSNCNNNNNNINNHYKKTSIFIIPNEYDNYNNNKKLKNKTSKKNIVPISQKINSTLEKEENKIKQAKSYFSPKIKSKLKMDTNNANYLSKSKSKIKIINKISKTYSSNEIKNNKKTNINNILNNNSYKNKNKTHSTHRITKDTIFEKENLNPNLYNTISTNININKRNKNSGYTNANTNETMNTILIKKNNSELLTFGNTNNDDSLSESFSKDENINKNFILVLKKENESLKNELKKTKEKVDVLENKIESLIFEKNSRNKIINKSNDNYNNDNIDKKTINKENIKYSKSQRYLKNNKNTINNHKKIKVKNIQRENSIKTKIIYHASSKGLGIKKYKQKNE